MNGQPVLVIEIGKSHVRLHGHMGLAAGRRIHPPPPHRAAESKMGAGFAALGYFLFIIDIGGARMDFHGILGHGRRRAHVGGQLFQIHLDLFSRGLGVGFRVCRDDGHGVSELEDLFIAENGPVPSVSLVGGKGDQAGDAVLALHVLVGDDLVPRRAFSRPPRCRWN